MSSANAQLDHLVSQLESLLAGTSTDAELVASRDAVNRQAVATELLQAMTQPDGERQQRARQLFIDHGYFDETIRELGTAESAAQRAAAARSLGIVGSRLATTPLIAALFDNDSEVREAAAAALSEIGDPSVVVGSVGTLLNGEIDWAAPRVSSEEADSSVAVVEAESSERDNESETMTMEGSVAVVELPEEIDVPEAAELTVTEYAEELVEEDGLLQQENSLRSALGDLEARLLGVHTGINEAERETRLRSEREANFRAEAAERRRKEEDQRRRAQSAEAHAQTENNKRAEAEQELLSLGAEENRLRLESENLREAIAEVEQKRGELAAVYRAKAEAARQRALLVHQEELARVKSEEQLALQAAEKAAQRRSELEASRQQADEDERLYAQQQQELVMSAENRRAEVMNMLREMEERNNLEQDELVQQLEKLRSETEEVNARRLQIELATHQAEADAQALAEAQARIKQAEEERRQAETERVALENEIQRRVEEENRRLEEMRRRFDEEQHRIEEQIRRQNEEGERRTRELQELVEQRNREATQRAAMEHQLRLELDRLFAAEADARARIEQAEVRRRASEETHRLTQEKAVKIEAEAHLRSVDEQEALAKLETIKRNVEVEIQARADQKKRIREEIQQLRKLSEEQRHRIEEETRRRVAAEMRLQQERERLRAIEEGRIKADLEFTRLVERDQPPAPGAQTEWRDEPEENLRPIPRSAAERETAEVSLPPVEEIPVVPERPSATSDLSSEDPSKRAAALVELAVSKAPDAFESIVVGFDDESAQVRNAAALALRELEPLRPVESFTKAFEEGSSERRKNIGLAIAESGLATEAVNALIGGSREDTYNALCLLFMMAKTGEVKPLVSAIEQHRDLEVRRAAIRLLALSGQSQVADEAVKRRLDGRSAKL